MNRISEIPVSILDWMTIYISQLLKKRLVYFLVITMVVTFYRFGNIKILILQTAE